MKPCLLLRRLLTVGLTAAVTVAAIGPLAWPERANAHGIPFSVGFDGSKITVSPGIYDNFSLAEQLVYEEEFDRITNGGEPGWDRAATLPLNTRLNIRFTRPLQYWNPDVGAEDPLPIPGGTIRVYTTRISGTSDTVPTGISGTNPRFLAQFTHHHHVAWVLENPDGPGLYGLWASLESENLSAFNALPSDPFLIVLNYGITSSTDYDEGVDRLAATAVPEPSTLALVGAAFAVAGWRWRRSDARGSVSRRRARG